MSIDAAIPGEKKVIRRGPEKILKYKDCTVQTERVWTVHTAVVTVITGETGTV
jgi:hypothetical protein